MIGVLSDSHDNVPAIQAAVELFNKNEVPLVLHVGDWVSPFAVDPFTKLDAQLQGVWGNNEGEIRRLQEKFTELGVPVQEFLELEYDEKRIAVYHGTQPLLLDAVIKSGKYHVVLTGHTHMPEVSMEDGVLVVNPGELCGYITGKKTLALVDPEQMSAEIVELK